MRIGVGPRLHIPDVPVVIAPIPNRAPEMEVDGFSVDLPDKPYWPSESLKLKIGGDPYP